MVAKIKSSACRDNLIGSRLKAEMKKRGIASAELAAQANVKTSFLYDIMSGKSANPSSIKLARVAQALDVSLSYLAGDAHAEAAPHESHIVLHHLPFGGGTNPLATSSAPSEPYAFDQNWISDHFGISPTQLRTTRVRGDSMEPTLCHNDLLLVDTSKRSPSPPGIFMMFDGVSLLPKRLEFTGDGMQHVRIISDNPHYSTYERKVEDCFIVGRVVWFSREI